MQAYCNTSIDFHMDKTADTAKYIQNILNDKESDCMAQKISKMYGIKTDWARKSQPRHRTKVHKEMCQKYMTY